MLPAVFQRRVNACSTLSPRCRQPMRPTSLPFLLFFFALWSTHCPVRCGPVNSSLSSFCWCMQLGLSWSDKSTMSSSSIPVSATASAIVIPTPTFISDNPVASHTSYLSSTSTSLIACIIPIVAMMYLVALSWAHQEARKHPKALNKTSGVWLQKYAPGMDSSLWGLGWNICVIDLFLFFFLSSTQVAYIFLVLSSLTEVSRMGWQPSYLNSDISLR